MHFSKVLREGFHCFQPQSHCSAFSFYSGRFQRVWFTLIKGKVIAHRKRVTVIFCVKQKMSLLRDVVTALCVHGMWRAVKTRGDPLLFGSVAIAGGCQWESSKKRVTQRLMTIWNIKVVFFASQHFWRIVYMDNCKMRRIFVQWSCIEWLCHYLSYVNGVDWLEISDRHNICISNTNQWLIALSYCM